MRNTSTDLDRLYHIFEAIESIESFMENISYDEYMK